MGYEKQMFSKTFPPAKFVGTDIKNHKTVQACKLAIYEPK